MPKSQLPIELGIIPAFAGNTLSASGTGLSCQDHPRIRGEHSVFRSAHRLPPGSSPHSRGTQGRSSIPWPAHGIIPAFAGNTCYADLLEYSAGDHPRIRGEHYMLVSQTNFRLGSSPHSRGTRVTTFARFSTAGIIPAFAGNTSREFFGYAYCWDHPRIRGEHVSCFQLH